MRKLLFVFAVVAFLFATTGVTNAITLNHVTVSIVDDEDPKKDEEKKEAKSDKKECADKESKKACCDKKKSASSCSDK
jgi:hypothetical protein